MKYQSELVKEIVDARGHEKSSLHYQSECIETWIYNEKGAYPKLCDYEGEWLNYIVKKSIGEFPYEIVTANPTATVNNVVPYAYKSAILKGSTKYRDIDTGEVLDAFEDGRNLELVSVKMPVLTTTGKNLWRTDFIVGKRINEEGNVTTGSNYACIEEYIKILPKTSYVISNSITGNGVQIFEYDSNKNLLNIFWAGTGSITTQAKTEYFRYSAILGGGNNSTEEALRSFQFEQGTVATSYEPYKSNILTVNEEVEMRGIGEVRDELNLLTGEKISKLEQLTLTNNTNWATQPSSHSDCYSFYYNPQIGKSDGLLICDNLPSVNSLTIGEGCRITGTGRININILKSKLNDSSLNSLNDYLAINPLTFIYELPNASIKTVDLSVTNQDGETINKFNPIEGTMNISVSGEPINPTAVLEVPVEAITQNLASFIEEK